MHEVQANALTAEEFLAILSPALTRAQVTHSVPGLLQEVQLAHDIRLSRGNTCRLMWAAFR